VVGSMEGPPPTNPQSTEQTRAGLY
jgi:hypothetical protein